MAADYYAQSEKTFEEVTLKFLKSNLYQFLEIYLKKVLERLDKKKEELKPQRVLLCTWIIELRLNEINNYQAQVEGKKDKESQEQANQAIQFMKQQFHEFLKDNA